MTTENDFIKAASLDDVMSGKMACVALQGKRILLANDNGTIYAADEMCTHEDASLCTGSLRGHLIKCPLHGSRFDLTTGEPLEDPADEPLTVYPVKIINNDIFVKIK
jgi:nitrite reductase/ring-hydroxylating ferredoxin subunit